MACETRWHQLFDELLDQILARLSLPDIFSFGWVCKQWRSAMLTRRSLCHPPPMMVSWKLSGSARSQTPGLMDEEYEVSLLCLIDDQLRKLSMDFPSMVMAGFDGFHSWLGNSYGWLLVKDPCWPAYLLNSLSGERITLPAPATGGDFDDIVRVALSSPPTSGCCTVITIIGTAKSSTNAKLASWRRGDGQWNVFAKYERHLRAPFCMSFHKGQLYVVQAKGLTEVYGADGHNVPEFLGFVDGWVYENQADQLKGVYLGGTDELFLVARVELREFDVFKLDARRWVKITNLGDQALFVSEFNTHCYRNSEIMELGLRANSIYHLHYKVHLRRYTGEYLSVYSMEDGSSKELLHPGVNLLLTPIEW